MNLNIFFQLVRFFYIFLLVKFLRRKYRTACSVVESAISTSADCACASPFVIVASVSGVSGAAGLGDGSAIWRDFVVAVGMN